MSAPADIVYLDYAATTPVDARVVNTMSQLFAVEGDFGNPSSGHLAGRRSGARVEHATEQLAKLLGCRESELIWTSGATESDNLAIAGAARYRADRGRHLITMPTEHKAVTDVFSVLAKQGFEVTWLQPDEFGLVVMNELEAAIREDTQLVSIMHVNNETGVIQDIEAIGSICRRHDVLYHVDAAQSVGKLPLDLATMPVDLLSTTAHKLYGPKGVGALYIADRPGCHVQPLIHGGGQQRALRPGTLAVPLIAGFGQAAEIAGARMQDDLAHLRASVGRDPGCRGHPDKWQPGLRLSRNTQCQRGRYRGREPAAFGRTALRRDRLGLQFQRSRAFGRAAGSRPQRRTCAKRGPIQCRPSNHYGGCRSCSRSLP